MDGVAANFAAAHRAWIHVVAVVCPAYAELGLDVPVLGEKPAVAVGYAKAGKPTLIATVLQFARVGAQKVDAVLPVGHVELTAHEVSSDKVSGSCFAEPVAGFGLHEPVLVLATPGESPQIELARDVERPLGARPTSIPALGLSVASERIFVLIPIFCAATD